MALNIDEQIIQHIQDARKVVIALEEKISADTLGSALALGRIIAHYDKPFRITVGESFDNYVFLTKYIDITPGLKQSRRLVVTLDISEQGLDKFYYSTTEDKKQLEIFIVPKDGFFNPDDVRVGQGGFEYDLIITVSASDLPALGNVYQNNTAFFHETPIINIDHKAANEKFGEINLVEATKSSASEIIFDFLQTNLREVIDKDVATALLAGILEQTQSFKVPTLTPQTLEKASQLMAYEADRDLVVRELFYNKSLPLVKLWGRVLARLKEDKDKKLYWSLINSDDYARAGAEPDLVDKVFEEVLQYLPRDATILLFSEFNGGIAVLGYSGDGQVDLQDLFAPYKPVAFTHGVRFTLFDRDLLELEQEVMSLF